MVFLRRARLETPEPAPAAGFPFNLPFAAARAELAFPTPITILVGENGTGKSSFLEALACALRLPGAGADDPAGDRSLEHIRPLADCLRLDLGRRPRQGFFLRAEDFFGYIKRLHQLREGLQADLADLEAGFQGRSEYARRLAEGPARGQLAALQGRYAGDLDARSHGESFIAFFQARCRPGGLYLLDEPEAPLSPLRQIGLIALLRELAGQEAQFILATHSPILMACPGATLISFDQQPPAPADYADLEHVRLTREFLNAPHLFLRHL